MHAVCLGLAAVSLVALANISNKYMTLIPMIGFGICWASMVGVPYLMVASMVPKERSRRVHGYPEHDDRHPDADRDRHLRLDLREPVRTGRPPTR